MRGKNRKPIASIEKLPQFTTMNVIEGQAGLVKYSSLIFYSLTLDNILNIIVLLILAGVTIATLTGENGILTKAQEASEDTKRANAEEQVKLAVQASYGEDGKINLDELNKELKKIEGLTYKGNPISDSNKITSLPNTVNVDGYDVTINGNGSVNIGENTVDGVTIPEGFYYVGGSKEEGIVISDSAEDENKGTSWEVAKTLKGNQFVWVPVEDDSAFKTYSGYYNNGSIFSINNCSEPYENGYVNEVDEYNAMKESVLDHDGFYVGRYEAGIADTVERTNTSDISDDIVIMQGKNVYNYIGFSNSDDLQVETGGALQKSKEFAEERGYTSVESTLIYGIQWDAIMQWIDTNYKKQDGMLTSFVADSTEKGNYSSTGFSQTGSSKNYAIKNIYDLGGNIWEWTMESYGTHARIVRGGYWYDTGFIYPASSRNTGFTPSRSTGSLGFRVALYLV